MLKPLCRRCRSPVPKSRRRSWEKDQFLEGTSRKRTEKSREEYKWPRGGFAAGGQGAKAVAHLLRLPLQQCLTSVRMCIKEGQHN
ncbi:hypothetical protein L596_001528 [Steinernema carpocapsae]|uniref:Uncharacterized protein n=1 Tax=Steinernema carpocapsae TaxID=34508 RepID=A0A4U8UP32_STECR|nr:hypothetical protein L596_001528 [Steinernema carpocapsae]